MKNIKFVMALVVMLCAGVQGYAQHYRHHHPAPHVHHRPYFDMPRSYYYHPSGYYYTELGVFWWGNSWDRPHKVRIDNIEFKRTIRNRLRIIYNGNGTSTKSYKSMWDHNTYHYTMPRGTVIEAVTGGNVTKIYVENAYGNTETHTP